MNERTVSMPVVEKRARAEKARASRLFGSVIESASPRKAACAISAVPKAVRRTARTLLPNSPKAAQRSQPIIGGWS